MGCLASEMAAAEKLIDLKKKDSAKYKANKNAQGKGGREKEKGHSGDKTDGVEGSVRYLLLSNLVRLRLS